MNVLGDVKRVGRYSAWPTIWSVLEPQTLSGVFGMFCDADRAGDLGTRESRSGMVVVWVHT